MRRENSCGCIFSARDVEPRTSANMSESSISAPPGRLSIERKHARQRRRFSFDGPKPNGLRSTLPGAPSGERQSLQRGPEGIFPNTARMYLSWPRSPLRTARQASSTAGSASETCSWSCSATGSVTAALWRSALGLRKRARTPEQAQRHPLSSRDARDDECGPECQPYGHGLVEKDGAERQCKRSVRVRERDRARRPQAPKPDVPGDVAEQGREHAEVEEEKNLVCRRTADRLDRRRTHERNQPHHADEARRRSQSKEVVAPQ